MKNTKLLLSTLLFLFSEFTYTGTIELNIFVFQTPFPNPFPFEKGAREKIGCSDDNARIYSKEQIAIYWKKNLANII